MFIYFVVFRFLILKFDFKTPGREVDSEIKFYSKNEYRESKKSNKTAVDKEENSNNNQQSLEANILKLLGGKDNIKDVTNCATRLRVNVKDGTKVGKDTDFKAIGTHGAKISGDSVQVIIGLDVPKVREKFETLLDID